MLGIDWLQILLHLLNFLILSLGLYFLLYNPVKKFMAKRRDYYKQMAEDAEKKKIETEALEEDYRRRIEEIDSEISKKKSKALTDADSMAVALIDSAREQGEKILAEAKTAAEREKQKILASANEEIMLAAVAATEKLVTEYSKETYDRFLDKLEKEPKE